MNIFYSHKAEIYPKKAERRKKINEKGSKVCK